jgi:hypothetical protein
MDLLSSLNLVRLLLLIHEYHLISLGKLAFLDLSDQLIALILSFPHL